MKHYIRTTIINQNGSSRVRIERAQLDFSIPLCGVYNAEEKDK